MCRSVYTRPVSILSCPHSLKFRGAALMWITEHLRGGGGSFASFVPKIFIFCFLLTCDCDFS